MPDSVADSNLQEGSESAESADAETLPMATIAMPAGATGATEKLPLERSGVFVRRRWRTQRRRQRSKRFLILLVLLVVLSTSGLVVAASYGVSAYQTYTSLRDHAYSGVQHLLTVKSMFTGSKNQAGGYLDATKLQRAHKEFASAASDFQQVLYTLEHTQLIQIVTQYVPQYRAQVVAARALSQIGIDIAAIGQDVVSSALELSPALSAPLLSTTRQPLVTAATLDLARATIDEVLPQLDDIRAQARLFTPAALPQISASQGAQLTLLLNALPQAEVGLTQARSLLGTIGWLLGVGQPRTFLVQTMDRAELRPTGGFDGQYGELSINGGRVGSFSLKDIGVLEYGNTSITSGQSPPAPYKEWWPIANWGLRDANLSADFPTSARIAIAEYKREVGHRVDGVITFTPFFIEHILQAIGPLHIPFYNETIRAQNLESRLHYYQQDNAGIRRQEIIGHVQDPAQARKLFTALLAQTLMNQIRHAPPNELLALARQAMYDLKAKDVQVYVANPQIETLLTQFGAAALLDRATTHDGLFIVQANLSASKASQYVRTLIHDVVTLDAKGGATHILQLRFVYSQSGPVYGLDTYRDYLRVYVPPASRFLWGDGFDSGRALCGGPLAACPQSGAYAGGELLCPAGQFQAGASTSMNGDPYSGQYHPLDSVGPPTNMSSDEPGRAMFAGWVVIPKNCTMNVALSWYVPPLSNTYSLLVQRQASTFPEVDVTLLPTLASCLILNWQAQHFEGIRAEDTRFAVKKLAPEALGSCYAQPGV